MNLDPQKSPAEFWQMARAMAVYSARAYDQATATDGKTAASAFVTVDQDGDIIVAFKGSSHPLDFLQDAKFGMRRFGYYPGKNPPQIHIGFFEDYAAIDIAVMSQVRALLEANPNAKIYITGHSLGGGEAIPCAAEFADQKLPIAAVFTFGQPRVGNRAFVDLYNSKRINEQRDGSTTSWQKLGDVTFHIVNADDPIPLSPPLLYGYRDEGTEVFLPANGDPVVNPFIGVEVIDDMLGAFESWRRGKIAFLPKHFISAYQERIAKL